MLNRTALIGNIMERRKQWHVKKFEI